MSKILIISATSDKNLELANELQSLLTAMGTDSGLVVLDKLNLPLYSYEAEIESGVVEEIIEKMNHASGLIFCAPEYNGNVPPVLSNAITWISVKSKNECEVSEKGGASPNRPLKCRLYPPGPERSVARTAGTSGAWN